MMFSINKERPWGMNNVFRLKGQRDVESMLSEFQSNFSLKVEFFLLFSIARIWPIYSLQVKLKGQVGTFPVYGRPRIIDLMT
jgi:hypothetical protein